MSTTYTSYPACFFKDDDEKCAYTVIFPDLGQATCGEDLFEAFAMAQDLLAGYIEIAKEDGIPVPAPSSIEEIDPLKVAKEIDADWVPSAMLAAMVTVDVEEYSSAYFQEQGKVICLLPTELIHAAWDAEIDFSQVLQEALETRMKGSSPVSC